MPEISVMTTNQVQQRNQDTDNQSFCCVLDQPEPEANGNQRGDCGHVWMHIRTVDRLQDGGQVDQVQDIEGENRGVEARQQRCIFTEWHSSYSPRSSLCSSDLRTQTQRRVFCAFKDLCLFRHTLQIIRQQLICNVNELWLNHDYIPVQSSDNKTRSAVVNQVDRGVWPQTAANVWLIV